MIDTKHIGLRLPTVSFEVEKGRLRFFAKATGETRPECLSFRISEHTSHLRFERAIIQQRSTGCRLSQFGVWRRGP